MSSKEANTISSSCYWTRGNKEDEPVEAYPDKFAIDFSYSFSNSNKDYILDFNNGEEKELNYKVRCCLYKFCIDVIDSTVNEELGHTTGKCVFLIKTFLRSVSLNYHDSRILPICLLLLDASTYKHNRDDIFDLNPYCQSDLGFDFLEVNEMNGYDLVNDKVKSMRKEDAKKLVVYLYQSELQKRENVKEIIRYCLSCRLNMSMEIVVISEWFCFPEEFGNLLQRPITANSFIQPILFPSTLQLLNNLFEKLIVSHPLPIIFPSSFLMNINSTLINYDFSIWSWVKSIKYAIWRYFSYQPASALSALLIQIVEKETETEAENDPPQQDEAEQPEAKRAKVEKNKPRYDLRRVGYKNTKRKGIERRTIISNYDKIVLTTNAIQTLEGKKLNCLKEFHISHSKPTRYDETKIMNSLHQLLSLWSVQPYIIKFYSTLLQSFVGEYSSREVYVLLCSSKRLLASDVHNRLVKAIQAIQDVTIFEGLLDSLEQLIENCNIALGKTSMAKKAQIAKIRSKIQVVPEDQDSNQNRKEAFGKVSSYKELRDHFKKQRESALRIKTSEKDSYFAVLTDVINTCFTENCSYLTVENPPIRSELHLSNRKTVIEGLLYPEDYLKCSCCTNQSITSSNDDLTILYSQFKDWAKITLVEDAKKEFFAVFLKDKNVDQEVVEARFGVSLLSLQYLGFLNVDENEKKIVKLDFALYYV